MSEPWTVSVLPWWVFRESSSLASERGSFLPRGSRRLIVTTAAYPPAEPQFNSSPQLSFFFVPSAAILWAHFIPATIPISPNHVFECLCSFCCGLVWTQQRSSHGFIKSDATQMLSNRLNQSVCPWCPTYFAQRVWMWVNKQLILSYKAQYSMHSSVSSGLSVRLPNDNVFKTTHPRESWKIQCANIT